MFYNLLFTSILLILATGLRAQDLSRKASDFLNTLSPELKSRTLFALDDDERYNMNYVPLIRKGPTFHDFNETQKAAAVELLRASLSKEGYRKTTEIIELENVLKVIENNRHKFQDGTDKRDPLKYYFCIFGDPSEDRFWGWRFEGHHLSLNFTSENEEIISSTPSFFGTNPAIVDVEGFDRKEVLQAEASLGFALLNSLTRGQRKTAIYSDKAPDDIISRTDKKVREIEQKGIFFKELSSEQKKLFIKLLNVYIDNYQFGFARTLRAKIEKAGLENLSFAWAGSRSPGKGHYYRIQGPMLLIEYDNTQNDANHVHAVVRDLTNDFAEDILKQHYQQHH